MNAEGERDLQPARCPTVCRMKSNVVAGTRSPAGASVGPKAEPSGILSPGDECHARESINE